MQTATAFKMDPWIGHEAAIMTRPAPTLYLIQFRKNVRHDFGANVTSLFGNKNWELHGSYEDEQTMVKAFKEVCQKPNVMNGLYTFRMLYPDGHTVESETVSYA